jgi:glycosyltransferase 2 family protein
MFPINVMIIKKTLGIVAGLIISTVLLFVSFFDVTWQHFFYSLRNVTYDSLFLFAFFIYLSYIVKAYMWRATMYPVAPMSISTLFGGIVVGCMINGILPFRSGELFRAYYLSSMTGCSKTMALSTIFIERMLDVVSLGSFVIIGLCFGIPGLSLSITMIIMLIWLFVVVITGLLIVQSEKIVHARYQYFIIPQKMWDIVFHFLAPLKQLREPGKIVYLIPMSILSWLCIYLSLLALINPFTAALKYEAAFLLFLFVNLSFLIPAAPGALGVIQLAFWFSLSHFGVPKEQALALSLVYLFAAYFINTSVGLPFFLRAHLWVQRKVIREEQQL